MHYSARYIILLFSLASLPICSMEIDKEESKEKEIDDTFQIVTDESNIPLLLTLCLQKITQLSSEDKKWHTLIRTKLTNVAQEKLQNHLREKFDLVIAKTFLDHQFKMPHTSLVYNIKNPPSSKKTDVPQKNIYWKKQPYHIGFVSIYSKFNNELTHIHEDHPLPEPAEKKFYMKDNKFIQITRACTSTILPGIKIAKYTVNLSRFNFLVQKSLDMSLADLLTMNSSSDQENQELSEKLLQKWQRQYKATTRKQKTTNQPLSAQPTKKQKIK